MGEGLRSRSSGLKPIETKRKGGGIEEYDMVTVEDEPLSPMARLFLDSSFDVHAVAFMACKTRISPQPVKDKLVHTLLKHPRFTSLMVCFTEFLYMFCLSMIGNFYNWFLNMHDRVRIFIIHNKKSTYKSILLEMDLKI